jgi:pimeloyl-ACP methyl ester carboxylesterase
MSLSSRTVDVNGVATQVLGDGTGDPLVFLHGAATLGGFEFADGWAGDFEVHVPLRPGYGESDDDAGISSMHDLVLHTVELLDVLGLERVHLVGHSMGGWLAARIAVEHPERVERLVLAGPPGLRVPEHPTTDIFALAPEALMPKLVADPATLGRLLPAEPSLDAIVGQYREFSSAARVLWERLHDPVFARWLHRARMPALLLWGAQDAIVPPAHAERWAALLPEAEVHMLEGVGHLPFHESDEGAEAVAAFLRRVPA